MQLPSIRTATPAICLAGMLAVLCLLAEFGIEKLSWLDLIFALPFYVGPSIILAWFGYQKTNSRALPVILFVGLITSTGLWILLAVSFREPQVVDAQSGMAIVMCAIVQWIIVALATLAFAFLRNRHATDRR
ncbi:MAG: hypothetical protein ACKVT0_09395 [Planctomycetaceae bacterium]